MVESTTSRLLVLACIGAAVSAGERRIIGDFSSKRLAGWESESFAGETNYHFVQVDGRTALRARCKNSASGLVLQQEVDLTRTPVLHWSWRIDKVYPGLNEKTRAGDDYPARVYVIHDGGLLKWRSRAVDYVWSSSQPLGETWPNAFVSQAMMVTVQSGAPARPKGWYEESRDVRKDFKRFFDLELDDIDAVALMTDCDNSRARGTAYYGDIYFSAD